MLPLTNQVIIKKTDAALLDRKALEVNHLSSIILMEEAAEKLYCQLIKDFQPLKRHQIAVLAGWGNNGGDALSLTRKLLFFGLIPDIYIFPDKTGSELYELHKKILNSFAIPLRKIDEFALNAGQYSIIIDGIFGIGYQFRPGQTDFGELYRQINQSESAKIIAVDVPSGLNTDGAPMIKADYTYSIGYLKSEYFNLSVRKNLGIIRDLKISFDLNNLSLDYTYLYQHHLDPVIKMTNNFVHKYSRGSCLAIGGQPGKLGSIVYTAESSIQAGAGIALVLTEKENVIPVNLLSKAVIVDALENLDLYQAKYHTVIIGPGLGVSTSNYKIIENLVKLDKQFILDASFFTIFTKKILKSFKKTPFLTPHTQEFKTFFSDEAADITNDTLIVVKNLAVKYQVYILLKDAILLFAAPDGTVWVFDQPCRMMAQAGSGDILCGIIGGKIAQGYSVSIAVKEAVRIFYSIGRQLSQKNSGAYLSQRMIELIGRC